MRGGDARSGPTHTPLRLPDTRARGPFSHFEEPRRARRTPCAPTAAAARPPSDMVAEHRERRTQQQVRSAEPWHASRTSLFRSAVGPRTFLPYEASKDADFSPRSLRPGIAERSHRLSSLCSCVREGKRRTASSACARRDSGKRRPPKARMSRCFPTYVVRAAGNGRRRTSRPFWGRERAGAQSPVILRDGIHARP